MDSSVIVSKFIKVITMISQATICHGNPDEKYHSLKGVTQGRFMDFTGDINARTSTIEDTYSVYSC